MNSRSRKRVRYAPDLSGLQLRSILRVACREISSWRVVFIEATTKPNCESIRILDFENTVNSSIAGKGVSQGEIEELIDVVNQFINLEVCGFRDNSEMIGPLSKDDLEEIADIKIEMVDSSYWEFSCLDDEINASLLKTIMSEASLCGSYPDNFSVESNLK